LICKNVILVLFLVTYILTTTTLGIQVESEARKGFPDLFGQTRGSQAPARPSGYLEESSNVYASMSTAA
jgi:hypothetical protein